MGLLDKINDEMKQAMRNKDQIRLNTLRMLKSKILAVDARGNLSDSEIVTQFKTYSKNLKESAVDFQKANRPEMVDQLQKELAIVQEFLPQELSAEETESLVKNAIEESKANSIKDLGKLIGILKNMGKPIDFKLANEIIRKLLPS